MTINEVIHLEHYLDHRPLCWVQDSHFTEDYQATKYLQAVTCADCVAIFAAQQETNIHVREWQEQQTKASTDSINQRFRQGLMSNEEEVVCTCPPGTDIPGNYHITNCPKNPAKRAYDDMCATLKHIDNQMKEVVDSADEMGCTVYEIRDANGARLLTPLLVARADVLSAIALMHFKGF